MIAATTSGIRSRVTLAVVVELGGAAGDAGRQAGFVAERRGVGVRAAC